jgi:SAM-dependent methyltransferase
MIRPLHLTQEDDPEVINLRKRMDAFYASSAEYPAFQQPSCNPEEWAYVKEAILQKLLVAENCNVLEFGAGRTGFPSWLGGLRKSIRFTAQDVTSSNADYLQSQTDDVQIGKIGDLRGSFDVIFSTFVLEHLSDPKHTLEALLRLLKPGGTLLLFSPRYDFPFYLSHSADHYGWLQRIRIALYVCWKRLATVVTRRPAFIIHADPALLHLDWRMDRDAIHWASLIDLKMFFRDRGRVRKLSIRSGSVKDWCVKNLLRINLRFNSAP